ncbi:MAG TPA: PTS sugar transporter subunit IIA [Kofleriaceae bacterium]|nr:PTS sugar transporter subunit IIA [Kofleriaceae bacterium]
MPSKSKPPASRDAEERLLTLADLAKYLSLGQKTVQRLASSNKLPGVLIDNQWRFKRNAIEEWLESNQLAPDVEMDDVVDGMEVPLGDVLPDEAVIADLRASDALGVIEELAGRAYSNRWLTDKPWFIGAVVERETLSSTAMDGGVAFLHTRARDKRKIARPFIIAGRSYNGINFGAPDGQPTFLFFLLGLQYDRMHLPILGRLARALRDTRTIAKLRSTPSSQKIRALLLKEDERARSQTKPGLDLKNGAGTNASLDRQQRLRAIMRRTAILRHEEKKAAEVAKKPKPKPKKVPVSKAEAATKKAAASKRAESAAKKAATAKRAAAGNKVDASSKKPVASAQKKPSGAGSRSRPKKK